MSERYSKLFSLPENLYAEGAPVIVSAGNLLKDNQTGKVLAQLKIKNIAAKPLKAATVLIHPQDAAGKPMADDTQQKYLDLTAKTGEEFGQKTAVFLPDVSARGFSVEVTQAVFADNSTWEGTAAPWESLPPAESLNSKLGDAELLKQYQIRFGGKCEAVPQVNKDLWRCACGTWNKGEKCYACENDKKALLSLDLDALKAERDARLSKEKAEGEAKEVADKMAAEAAAEKAKKMLAVVLPLIAVCAAALLIITRVVIPNSNYNKAKTLFDAGQYEEAISVFEALNGYKDSEDQLTAARNAKADEEHAAAEAQKERENEENYQKALSLIFDSYQDNDTDAYNIFIRLGEYKDANSYVAQFKKVLLSSKTPWWSADYHYDSAGKLILAYEHINETNWDQYEYSYDELGRLSRVVYTTNYNHQFAEACVSYDEPGYLKTLTVSWPTVKNPYSFVIKYDTNNLPVYTKERDRELLFDYSLDNQGYITGVSYTITANGKTGKGSIPFIDGQMFRIEDETWTGRIRLSDDDIFFLGDAGNGTIYRYKIGAGFVLKEDLRYQCSYNSDGTLAKMDVTGGTRDYSKYYTYGYVFVPTD